VAGARLGTGVGEARAELGFDVGVGGRWLHVTGGAFDDGLGDETDGWAAVAVQATTKPRLTLTAITE